MIRLARKTGMLWISVVLILVLVACNTPVAVDTSGDILAPVIEDDTTLVTDTQTESDDMLLVAVTTPEPLPVDECLTCHLDKQRLIDTAAPEVVVESESSGEGWGGEVPPLEAWAKVLVNGESYPETVHGQIACIDCHDGVQSPDKETAHTGLIANPSDDPEAACGECHPDVVEMNQYSLHNNLAGYWTVLEPRYDMTDAAAHDAISEMFGNHCDSCHATCGECHVSQPALVGGGFIDGHMFNETPSMTRNCTACHGSRVGNEYLGKHEGLMADVHLRMGRMNCVDCHSGHEMHGQPAECQTCHTSPDAAAVPPADHRYAGVQQPRCETCHVSAALGQDGYEMHQAHGGDLSCQVCHSIAYTNCDNCHVALSETTGNPYFATDASYQGFYIGLNPIRSYDRPYQYVPVRHIPVSPESFSFYGADLLTFFNALPTWKYTTPHNIQRITPQAETCNACHGNADLFLTIDKVKPEEVEANLAVIVDIIPPLIITNTISSTMAITNTMTTTVTLETTP